ncbi:uncharacterized protein K460DRAFT_64757 [Cucurbitaria berberidis CBS 394.84]|uniref:GEgh 16 protein n=1 Tax=Cucurbitaria berberidis CBS 394.84 TaxID=1168544 RepID=A0A9P4GLX2_9PLEO|nr:uncharacterized protein K460DRAFT_64757 [Cucurbitaria berberidis CBS 394.84]KAF1847859.1 hypothetical protein K460DRAFT_64757 [Cucurbitaria berberidis CBS 394.84]
MYYQTSFLALAAVITTVHSHAAILAAVGDSGTSQGFLVDPAIARNCTTISPCQQDATIIRNSEITQNIVNACGRTEIAGNIDIGEQTENELAAGRMAQVKAGSMVAVTIHQVNADGAGPFECDMDETSNAVTTFRPLKVSNNVPGTNGLSQAKEKEFTINVQMPDDFNCIGASTGNICTVRCRNNAVAGPFGGCFAVQQTDGTGRTNTSAAAVDTSQTLEGISAQILQNKKDLPAAIAANQAAGAAGGNEGASAISALLPTQTAAPDNGKGKGKGNQNGKGKGKDNQNGKGKGKGNDNQAGKGKGKGNGQGKGKGKAGKGKGAGNADQNANGNGKGKGKGNGFGGFGGFGGGNVQGRSERQRRPKFLS